MFEPEKRFFEFVSFCLGEMFSIKRMVNNFITTCRVLFYCSLFFLVGHLLIRYGIWEPRIIFK